MSYSSVSEWLYFHGINSPHAEVCGAWKAGPEHPSIAHALAWLEDNASWADARGRINAMILECPRMSEKFPGRVAYARKIEDIPADRWTVAKVGGYIHRHFPEIPGHIVESCVSRADVKSTLEFYTDDEMVRIIQECNSSVSSCMTKHFRCGHPYQVYSSRLGWKLAILRDGSGEIAGRALINGQIFVRIYGRADDGGIRGDEPGLRSILLAEGYFRADGWSGCRMEAIEGGDGYLAPYLDGHCSSASLSGDVWIISPDGDIDFSSTDGSISDHSGQVQTDSGDWIDEDDSVTLHDGTIVHVDDAALVGDDWYPSSEVVCDHGGENILRCDAVRIRGSWYSTDDDLIVYCDQSERYILRSDSVEVDDGYVHEDLAVWVDSESCYILASDAVEIGSQWIRKSDAIEVDGEFFLPDDLPGIVAAINAARAQMSAYPPSGLLLNGERIPPYRRDHIAQILENNFAERMATLV